MTDEHYHFIGIGGIGMSGLARLLLQRGKEVSGSDIATSYVTESLSKAGATLHLGHHKDHIKEGATVIYSSDIPQDNPELVEAKKRQYPLLHRSDLLVDLMQNRKVLAVAGTHGKTTTTSLLTHLFRFAKLKPAFAVGGMLQDIQANAGDDGGEHFIVEADESDGTFLKYPYHGAIVTNIDTDHLAHFGNWQTLVSAFVTFMKKAPDPDLLFYCQDDKTLLDLSLKGVPYGFSEKAVLRASGFRQSGWRIFFDITFEGKQFSDIEVNLTGQHNALNALAAFGIAYRLGVDEMAIREALSSFSGVKRRMDKKGEHQNILIYDDYAHHPTEIVATLRALRQAINQRHMVAVFQPHRFSRMRYVMNEFIGAFDSADSVIVTDLYTANEPPVEGVSTEAIIEQIQRNFTKPLVYMPRDLLVESLTQHVRPHDVVITLGAGDITKVGPQLLLSLSKERVVR